MSRRDDEIDEELASHLRLAIGERVARGESPEAAERAARREFGNVTHVKEVTREVRSGIWLERLLQDVKYGARALRRTPGFTVVAVLTLALAIGANSAVFTVVNGVLLQPLPFRDPEKLYLPTVRPVDLPFEVPPGMPDRLYLGYRERAGAFADVTAYMHAQVTLSGAGDAASLRAARVGADFFSVLGVAPAVGRAFAREDERSGHDKVVILGHALWRTRFAADPAVLGRPITIDGVSHVVVGVMPEGFRFPASSQLWTPLVVRLDAGNSFFFPVVGRLRDGVTARQANEELTSVARSVPPDPRDRRRSFVASFIPLKELLTAKAEKPLLLFSGAVAFVLLIACANVANLLLIRAATRRRELAVRVALGASRTRIVRQLLTESLLVALAGAGAGILVAVLGVRTLLAIAPEGRIPRLEEVQIDGWVLTFNLVVAVVTGVAFGVGPALAGARRQPQEALTQGNRALGAPHGRLRATLVAAEIALALVLLTGAGLMIRSFLRMRAVDVGFDPARVVTMTVDLPRAAYPDAERVHAFHSAVLERLGHIPGVRHASAVSFRPMAPMGIMGDFRVEGRTPVPDGFSVDKPTVGPGYFEAMGIRLLRGRDFSPRDDLGAPGVVIVSESVARRVWPGEDAVGKRISMEDRPRPDDWLTVVGVVADVVQDGELTKRSTIYVPYRQAQSLFFIDHMTYVVRAEVGSERVAPAMRAALREVDETVPAQALQTMAESMLDVVSEPLFHTRLLTVFSLLALLLAAVGTYGVLAYDVSERTREIGLRLALGATGATVMWMVMRRTAWLAGWGAVVGVATSLAVTRVLAGSLYEVKPTDPATLVAVVAAIASVALFAGYVPARRATRVPPLVALSRD